jgi:Flp pilus assembly pilin Flp
LPNIGVGYISRQQIVKIRQVASIVSSGNGRVAAIVSKGKETGMIQNLGLKIALQNRKGMTAMEYGVLAAATMCTLAAVGNTIGTDISSVFPKIQSDMTAA